MVDETKLQNRNIDIHDFDRDAIRVTLAGRELGTTVDITAEGELNSTLVNILKELKKINLHLGVMSDVGIDNQDIIR